MQAGLEGDTTVYSLVRYTPKDKGLVYSKANLVPRPASNKMIGLRVYPYPHLFAKINSRPTKMPHWIFHKKSLASGNIEVSSIEASPFSYYVNEGRLMFLFSVDSDSDDFNFNRSAIKPLGFGAKIDGITYPSLGHIFSISQTTRSPNSVKYDSLPNGDMCYGTLNFMFKQDNELPGYSGPAYGWNTDLTNKLNTPSLSHRSLADPIANLTFDSQ